MLFAIDDGSGVAEVEALARLLTPLLEPSAQLELWPSSPTDDH